MSDTLRKMVTELADLGPDPDWRVELVITFPSSDDTGKRIMVTGSDRFPAEVAAIDEATAVQAAAERIVNRIREFGDEMWRG